MTNKKLSDSASVSKELKNLLRIEHPLNLIFFYLNINSIRKKFRDLRQVIISDRVVILAIGESRINS